MNLEQLRKALAELVKGLTGLKAKAFGTEATADDTKVLEDALAEIESLEAKIALLEKAEATEKRAAAPANTPAGSETIAPVPAGAKHMAKDANEKLGIFLLGAVKAYKDGKGRSSAAAAEQMRELGYDGVADEYLIQQKTMTTIVGADGGILTPPSWNLDIIPLLYETSTFMAGGPRIINMPTGNYHQPKGLSGATASYRAEGEDISVSQPTLADINMSAKLLSVIVPATNQLLRWSLGAAMEFIREDMGSAMSTKLDEMAYLGTGTSNDPLGIFRRPGINTSAAAAGVAPSTAVIDGAARSKSGIMTRYAALRAGAKWVMTPRVFDWLYDLRNTDGSKVFPELASATPMWKGYPVLVTGTIPENLGTATNETYLALVSFRNVLFGETKGLSIKVSDEATIMPNGPTGDPVSMFSTDSTAIRATMEHDFGIRYNQAVNVLSAVQWGASA
jgi:HK97 family phage major capsid protein